jgi:sarcosine oxidase
VSVHVAGRTVTGDVLIVAVGSWLPKVMPDLPMIPTAERRVMAWYRPTTSENLLGMRFPIFVLDADGGWYGMPTPDGAVKIGHDKHLRQGIDPDQPPAAPNAADAERLAPCIRNYFTGISQTPSALKPCIYTLADDHHFIIDWHPRHSRVLIFSCCSGHGFKYAPEYGDIAADLVSGKPRPDLAPFSYNRTGAGVTRFGP